MSTYSQLIYQIVFGTKLRERTLAKENREELFKYIAGLLQNKKCFVFIINGVEDHIHIVTHIHPTLAISPLVKDIKLASSVYIKEKKLFKNFRGWQEGYGVFSYSVKEKDRLIEYVKNQEVHHWSKTFKEEYCDMLKKNEVDFDERYFL